MKTRACKARVTFPKDDCGIDRIQHGVCKSTAAAASGHCHLSLLPIGALLLTTALRLSPRLACLPVTLRSADVDQAQRMTLPAGTYRHRDCWKQNAGSTANECLKILMKAARADIFNTRKRLRLASM